MDQLPWLGKREFIRLLLFTCNYVVSVGEVSSSSECLGWATLFYCGTPWAFHIIILQKKKNLKLQKIARCVCEITVTLYFLFRLIPLSDPEDG